MKLPALLIMLLSNYIPVYCQEKDPPEKYTDAIEDNSFFIEESYNQEERVVQHISNAYYRTAPSRDIMYSFTQEWPLIKYKHQISYTIPYSFVNGNSLRGFGDILINYRYQLFYKEKWACVSPRLSFILPTGEYKKGLGYDAFGVQVNLPVSKRLSDFWVIHFNAGYTLFPEAKSLTAENETIKKTLSFYNLGGSVIWLTSININFMLECIENLNSSINIKGNIEHTSETILNPGIRVAINLGQLQIVPGLSMPLFISNHETNPGLLIYLSFEHPY